MVVAGCWTRTMSSPLIFLFTVVCAIALANGKYIDDDPVYSSTDPSVREPRPCEVCKYLITELSSRLAESGRSKEVLQIGQQFDADKKRVVYKHSELRLIEALHEPHICENILKYNVHAERAGSHRYARGQSETMATLHGLVNKGVDVKMDIPYELWDQPSAEVTKMHRACFSLVERYEEDIEAWYADHQNENLADYICRDRYLKHRNGNPTCLTEVATEKNVEKGKRKKSKKTKKEKKNQKGESADFEELQRKVDEL